MLTLKDLPSKVILAIRKGLGENVAIGDDAAVMDQISRAGLKISMEELGATAVEPEVDNVELFSEPLDPEEDEDEMGL